MVYTTRKYRKCEIEFSEKRKWLNGIFILSTPFIMENSRLL